MRAQAALLLAAAAAGACGDDATQPTGGAAAGGAGGSETGGAASGGGAAGGAEGGGGSACDGGSREQVVGRDGGTLTFCGATLEIPAGALADDATVGIAIDPSPPDPPFHYEVASPAFVMTPSDLPLLAPASVTIPHAAASSRFELAVVDEANDTFAMFEACMVTDTSLQQFVGALGTFAVLRDVVDYPESTTGLGSGEVELTFLGETKTYDVDAQGNYAIFQSSESGDRTVTIDTLYPVPDGVESLRIDFVVDAAGTSGSLVQVQWISTVTSQGYSFIDGLVGADGTIDVTEQPDGRLVGTLSATLSGGDPMTDQPLAATFDITADLYAFPPELSCPGGE